MKTDKNTKSKTPSTGKTMKPVSTLITKEDWKTMPRDSKGMITYETIKKTRAAKTPSTGATSQLTKIMVPTTKKKKA